TVTPMGARALRDWLSQPLAEVGPIRRRQEAVRTWIAHAEALERFQVQLAEVRDLERTIGRLSVGTGNARDLLTLRLALEQLPGLKKTLSGMGREAPHEPNDILRAEVFEMPYTAAIQHADAAQARLALYRSRCAGSLAL